MSFRERSVFFSDRVEEDASLIHLTDFCRSREVYGMEWRSITVERDRTAKIILETLESTGVSSLAERLERL
jgi:hypothetical protein